ncbi:MAG: DHA2 family efflux MFS transporter permease subunit [Caldilineaceae bacterium]|nr:DHA2 family efflux MFS transporter permease subunit [Caldilineaceae bacterium]MDE0338078.1 DHA2 family efflux MFS transporter permease subunit [Caldilineaceae bacterium]
MNRTVPNVEAARTRKWVALLAVIAGILVQALNQSTIQAALPTLSQELGANFTTIQWVLLSFQITLAVVMLSVGRLADMFGKRRIFIAGNLFFGLASLLCALSPNVYFLIGFRVLQSAGAAVVTVLSMAIVAEIFPDSEKGRVLGIAAGSNSFGHFVGPILGGYLIGAYGWRIAFFILVPCAVLAALLAARYLPALSPSGTSRRFDILGATLIGATMCSLSLGLSYGQLLGFAHIYVLLLFAGSAISFAAFLYAERRVAHPVLDFELFRSRPFTLHIAIAALAGIATSGVTFLLPFFMQLALGLTILQVGFVMAIVSIEIALIAPAAGYLADRLGAHRVTLIGLATLLVGFLVASTSNLDNSQLGFLLRILPMGIGIGLFMSPNSTVIMAAAPATRLGVASGLIGLTRMIGQTTGIALLGAVFASNVARSAGMPVDVTDASPLAISQAFRLQFFIVAVVIGATLLWSLKSRPE